MIFPSHFPDRMWSHFGSASAIARSTAEASAKNAETTFLSYSGFGRWEPLRLCLDRRLEELLGFGKCKGFGSIPNKRRLWTFKQDHSQTNTCSSTMKQRRKWQLVGGMCYLPKWSEEDLSSRDKLLHPREGWGTTKFTLSSLSYDRVNGMIQSKVNDNKNSEMVLSFHYWLSCLSLVYTVSRLLNHFTIYWTILWLNHFAFELFISLWLNHFTFD